MLVFDNLFQLSNVKRKDGGEISDDELMDLLCDSFFLCKSNRLGICINF